MTAATAAGFRHRYAAWSLDAAVLLLAAGALAWPKLRVARAAVGEAVTELTAAQQRRSVEDAAFDNVWRGL